MKRKSSSLARDFILISIILAILIIILSIWFTWRAYTDQSENIKHTLESISQRIERVIIDDLDYTAYQMEYAATQIEQKPSSDEEILKILSGFRGNHKVNIALSWNMFSWVNKEGYLTVDGNLGILSRKYNMLNRDYIPCTKKSPGKLCIGSQPVYGAVSKQWIIPAGMGIVDKENKYLGTIIFGFDINSMIFKLEQTIANESIGFAIIDNNKIILESDNNKKINSNLDLIKLFQENFDENQNFGLISKQRLFNKDINYVHYSNINQYPFNTIILSYDKDTSYKHLWQLCSTRIIEFCILLLGSLTILYLIYKKIINPIIALSRSADEISKGCENVIFPESTNSEILLLEEQLKKVTQFISSEKTVKQELSNKKSELEEINKKFRILNQDLEKKVIEQTFELKSALAAKSEFLNKISIEIRTPINTVINYAKSLMYDWEKIDQIKKHQYVENIYKNASRLMILMNNILDLSKFDSGKMIFSILENDLIKIIKNVINKHKASLDSNIIFESECEKALCHCDKEKIIQLVDHILNNAIKFSNNKIVKIIINKDFLLDKKGKLVEAFKISIEDQGIGIPKGEEEEIFHKFSQSSRTKSYEGSSGLSLALCSEIISAHNGKIWADNKVKKGAIINFIIPKSIEE